MHPLDLEARPGPPVPEEAHHLGVGVEFDLMLEVLVGQRNETQAAGTQRRLTHHSSVALAAVDN